MLYGKIRAELQILQKHYRIQQPKNENLVCRNTSLEIPGAENRPATRNEKNFKKIFRLLTQIHSCNYPEQADEVHEIYNILWGRMEKGLKERKKRM